VPLAGQGSRDTIEQGLPDLCQGLVDGIGERPTWAAVDAWWPRRQAAGQQIAVGRAEFFDAVGEPIAALLELRASACSTAVSASRSGRLAEQHRLPLPFLDEIQHLEVGNATAPGDEVIRRMGLVELVPEGDATSWRTSSASARFGSRVKMYAYNRRSFWTKAEERFTLTGSLGASPRESPGVRSAIDRTGWERSFGAMRASTNRRRTLLNVSADASRDVFLQDVDARWFLEGKKKKCGIALPLFPRSCVGTDWPAPAGPRARHSCPPPGEQPVTRGVEPKMRNRDILGRHGRRCVI
jgi:hypothetical protein